MSSSCSTCCVSVEEADRQIYDLMVGFNDKDLGTCLECATMIIEIMCSICPHSAIYIFAMTNYGRFDIENGLFLSIQEPADLPLQEEHYIELERVMQDRRVTRWDDGTCFLPASFAREDYGALIIKSRDSNSKPPPFSETALQLICIALAQKWSFLLEYGRSRIFNEVSNELTEVMECVYAAIIKFVDAPPKVGTLTESWEGIESLIQRKISEMAQQLVPCDQIALWMVEGDELMIHTYGLRVHAVKEFAGRVVIAGTPLVCSEPQESSLLGPWQNTLAIPIIINGNVVAVLQFIDRLFCAGTHRFSHLVEAVDRSKIDDVIEREQDDDEYDPSRRSINTSYSHPHSHSEDSKLLTLSRKVKGNQIDNSNGRSVSVQVLKESKDSDKAAETRNAKTVFFSAEQTIDKIVESKKDAISRSSGEGDGKNGKYKVKTKAEVNSVQKQLHHLTPNKNKKKDDNRSAEDKCAAAKVQKRGFTACDVEVASILINGPIFLALRAASLAAKLAREKRNAIAANSFNVFMTKSGDLSEFTELLCKKVATTLNAERCSLFFVDIAKKQLWSPPTHFCPVFINLPFGKSIIGHVAETSRMFITNSPDECPFWEREPKIEGEEDPDAAFQVKHIMAAPIVDLTANKVIAVVQLLNKTIDYSNISRTLKKRNTGFSIFDAELLTVISKEASIHLQRLSYNILEMRALRDEKVNNGIGIMEGSMRSLVEMHFGREKSTMNMAKRKQKNRVTGSEGNSSLKEEKIDHKKSKSVKVEKTKNPINFLTRRKIEDTNTFIDFFRLRHEDDLELVHRVLDEAGILHVFDIEELVPFLKDVRHGYLRNPYHNWLHALQCFHQSYLTCRTLALFNDEDPNSMSAPYRIALLIGSLGHDIGHRGRGNVFEIAVESVLSYRYNDRSVLENYHCARLHQIIRKREIFVDLTREVKRELRECMVESILATDMIHHSAHVADLDTNFSPEKGESPHLVSIIMHANDIGAYMLPLEPALKFGKSVMMEFTQQVEDERRLGLNVTAFMDGLMQPKRAAFSQVGFIDYVVFPLWEGMQNLRPEISIDNLKESRKYWDVIANATDEEAAIEVNRIAPPFDKEHESWYYPEIMDHGPPPKVFDLNEENDWTLDRDYESIDPHKPSNYKPAPRQDSTSQSSSSEIHWNQIINSNGSPKTGP